ncbi:hypothetical protein D3C87_1896140 [compost metagenome]
MLTAGSLDCLDEVFVVPSIDLARPGDIRRVREHLFEFWYQWAIGALFEACREDGRQLEKFGYVSQRQHVVFEFVRGEILNQ